MLPFGPRRYRFVRYADGSIREVRPATDPVFDRLWMQDPEIREYLETSDRAWRRSRGATAEDEKDLEKAKARLRDRLTMRRAR